MKKIGIILTLSICMSAFPLLGQNIHIRGIVTDASDNAALPGAFIAVKGTQTVTSTLNDGTYSLTAPSNGTLVFSFIGMTTHEVPIQGREVINVALTSANLLEEVVVTGLGVSREKKALGYAVQQVGSEEFTRARTGNVVSSLSGRVAGVQITAASGQMGGGAKINVRGNTSLYGNNQPLFVVDGIPLSNADYSTGGGTRAGYNQGNLASDISPDDIESMSILKGASATAIYGSRGANGVVLITSKKAAMGVGQKSFGVSVNSSVTVEQVGIIPQYQKLYGGGSGPLTEITVDGKKYLYPDLDTDESWGQRYDPNIYALSWNSFDAWDTANYLVAKPWVYPAHDYTTYFKTGVGYNNNIQLSGAGDGYSYRLSYSNLDQTGIFTNSKLKRNNVSFSTSARINKVLESFFTANYVSTRAKGRPEVGYGDNNTAKTMFQWTQTQLDYKELQAYKNPDGTQRSWNRRAYNNATPLYADNPYWSVYENYESDNRDRFFGSGGIYLTIADGLKLTGRAGVDAWMYKIEQRSAVNSTHQSAYDLKSRINVEVSGDLFLNYNKRFVDNRLGVGAMAGAGSNNRNYTYTGGYTVNGLIVPGVYNLKNSVNTAISYDTKERKRINSVYGSVTFDWDMLVYVDVTARNDWSSTLPKESNSYFYPSVNLSFILSQLKGVKDLGWLNFAKLRAGYAAVGNDTDPYRLQNYFEFQSPFGSDPMFTISTTLQNPHLRPEKTKSWEVGLEAQLFSSRLGIDLAYYEKTTIDQIIPASISGATGYLYRYINTGELSNKGVEVTLNASPVRVRNGLQWDMQFNLATLKNKVVSIAPGIKNLDLGNNGFSVYTSAVPGQAYPVIFGKNFVYGPNGEKLIGANGLYLKTSDNVPLGKVTPDFTAGFSNSFTWRGVDLTILLDMQMGGHIYYLSHKYGMQSGLLKESARETNVPEKTGNTREEGWLFPGVLGKTRLTGDGSYEGVYIDAVGKETSTPVPNAKVVTGYQYATHFTNGPDAMNMFTSDYVKLREVRLGYTFPKSLTGPSKGVRLSAFGRNLATFMTDQNHFDPEYLQMAGSNAQGLEGGYIPTTRTYGFSIELNF